MQAAVATGWRDRGRAAYDGLLASAGFRRWAAKFPLTRPIARRRARALFDLCAGFVYAQVLAACVQVQLFDVLSEGPKSAAAIGLRCGLTAAAATRLLDAAAGLTLVSRRRGGRYGLGPLGAAMIGNPGVAAMVAHHAALYADLRDPVALLRGQSADTALSAYWPYEAADPARARVYSDLMAASQAMVAQEVLNAYPVTRHRHLLDIGGGNGCFVAHALDRAPALRATVFDLPAVADLARQRFAADSRVFVAGGDFHADPLPRGADLVTLIRVIHDHDDAQAAAILRAARQALAPGGTLLLAEPMAATPGAASVGTYFEFYLLAMGRGRPRTRAELTAMLRRAGFDAVRARQTDTPLIASVLTAVAV